jgi:ubiquitin-conjugating enzyme E2 Q
MPRKQFIADVQVAADKNIFGISSVVRGDDDGEVVAYFVPPTGAPIEISLLAQPGT